MKNTILRILKYCRPYRHYLILTILSTLAGNFSFSDCSGADWLGRG